MWFSPCDAGVARTLKGSRMSATALRSILARGAATPVLEEQCLNFSSVSVTD